MLEQALEAWQVVRALPERRSDELHLFTVGEVKTATDPSNLHERLALGSRETRDEAGADRFLLMAVLTNDIVRSDRRGRRQLQSRDVTRFSAVFNLYFAWGWDDARASHPEHWGEFREQVARWCGLGPSVS